MGVAFYDALRQALYGWIRVYDDWDARNRIEQMVEWAEASVRRAFAVIETLMQVLLLTVRIKTIIEGLEKSTCDSASMSAANSN
jgi:hypothetical protein